MSSSSVIASIEVAIVVLMGVRMVIAGFFQKPGQVFSWPMFTRGCQILIDLEVNTENGRRPADPMPLLPAHHPSMSVPELEVVLDYLNETRGPASGTGVIYTVRGTLPLRVEGGRVVD
jgi:hypothetical protein